MDTGGVALSELVAYCDQLLGVERFKDYCPNGLQVEGAPRVRKLISGVTASQALVDQACAQGADAVLVHHGYFWRNEAAPIVGMKRRRVGALLAQDVSLLAYHLPLDAHQTLGNNAQLGLKLGLQQCVAHEVGGVSDLLWQGRLAEPMTGEQLGQHLGQRLARPPLHVAVDRPIQRVAWCTGGAQGYIAEAAALGVDAFISGEASEATTHIAREMGLHYFAAGHHATERYGVQALGEHLAERFALTHLYIEVENPV